MKKLLFALLLLPAFLFGDDEFTPKLNLTKPEIGSFGWGEKTNLNWDVVDSSVAVLGGYNLFGSSATFQGIVRSSTGGFKFPDGTVQITAFTGASTGTITAITVSNGLTGGGNIGTVDVGISPGALPVNVSLPADQITAGTLGGSVVASSLAVNSVYTNAIQNIAVTDAKINSVSGTKVGAGVPAANIASGSLGSSVLASSVAVNSVNDSAIVSVSGSKVIGNIPGNAGNITGSIAASQVSAGSLGAGVIASSVAVNSVTNPAIVSVAASKIIGLILDGSLSGTYSNPLTFSNPANVLSGDGSNLTGVMATSIGPNTVGTTQIINSTVALVDLNQPNVDTRYLTTGTVQTISAGKVFNASPPFAVGNTSVVTNLNADLLDGQDGSFYQNAGNLNAGTLPSGRLSGTYSGALTLSNPANVLFGDGSNLTGITATMIGANSVGTTQLIDSSVTLTDLNTASVDTHYVTTGTAQSVSGAKTFTTGPSFTAATPFSVTNPVLVTNLNAELLNSQNGAFYQNASNLNAGTLPDARLSGSYTNALTFNNAANSFTGNSVTVLGNAFSVGGSTLVVASGNIGLGTGSPSTILDLAGAMTVRNQTAPGVAPAGQGRIYFDTATNQFKVSENTGAFTNLIGGTPGASTVGTTQIIDSTVALVDLNTADIDTRYVTTGTAQSITATKTYSGGATMTGLPNPALGADAANKTYVDIATAAVSAAILGPNTIGTTQIIDSSVTLNDLNTPTVDTRYLTTGTVQSVSGAKTFSTAPSFTDTTPFTVTATSLVSNLNTDLLDSQTGSFYQDASNLNAGTIQNGRLDSSSVTLQGNTFNGVSQLVRLNGSGTLSGGLVSGGTFGAVNGQNLTALSPTAISAGALGAGVVASSLAINSVYTGAVQDQAITAAKVANNTLTDSQMAAGTFSNISVPAANVNAGSLGASVIASSIAVNAVANPSIVSMDASKLTGTIANSTLDSSSVTKQGNTFNGASQLVRLNGSGTLSGGLVSGGTFGAVNGSALTNLTADNISAGSLGASVIASSVAVNSIRSAQITDGSVALADLNTSNVDTRYVTTGTVQGISGAKTHTAAVSISSTTLSVAGSGSSALFGASGTAVTQMRLYTATVNPGTVLPGTGVNVDVTLTGVSTGDTVFTNPGIDFGNGCALAEVRVTAADTVRVRIANGDAGTLAGNCTVNSSTWRFFAITN